VHGQRLVARILEKVQARPVRRVFSVPGTWGRESADPSVGRPDSVQGLFITFEGIDKSGKTTQAESLVAGLRGSGRRVLFTHEPGGTPLGRELRELALGTGRNVGPLAEIFLFTADRAQHVADVIVPALAAGKPVVCDRFSDSTIAYQGYGRGTDVAQLREIQKLATGGLEPDLTVLVDVDVGTLRARLVPREADRLEGADDEFYCRVRNGFLAMSRQESHRFLVVDGRLPRADLSRQIHAEVLRRITRRP